MRNTKFVYGLAINTGHQCKLMLNANAAPSKMSNLMRVMNKCLYIVFAFQAVLCLLNTIAAVAVNQSVMEGLNSIDPKVRQSFGTKSQLGLPYSTWVFGFETYLTFVVAYSNLIPISLYVGIELMKLIQKFLVDNDCLIYYAVNDTPACCRTSNLIEELGQVGPISSCCVFVCVCVLCVFVCVLALFW